MSFFENTRKPEGFGGELMVSMMNLGHRALSRWGLSFLKLPPDGRVLDCGCGGGANLKTLLKQCPQGIVKGIDDSAVSVEKARAVNEIAVRESGSSSPAAGLTPSPPLRPSTSGPGCPSVSGRFTGC